MWPAWNTWRDIPRRGAAYVARFSFSASEGYFTSLDGRDQATRKLGVAAAVIAWDRAVVVVPAKAGGREGARRVSSCRSSKRVLGDFSGVPQRIVGYGDAVDHIPHFTVRAGQDHKCSDSGSACRGP